MHCLLICALALLNASFHIRTVGLRAQSAAPPEEFIAIAMMHENFTSGAGQVTMRVTRWSTMAERDRLAKVLRTNGPGALLKELRRTKRSGTINTPDSRAYDVHYAYQILDEDGGRDIVLATDRPIVFWEARNQPRTIRYPFTVIQLHMASTRTGKGSMTHATPLKVVDATTIELENFSTAPILLTQVTAREFKPTSR